MSLYNQEIQVPLIFWLPAGLPARQISAPVSVTDIVPTVLHLLGYEIPPTVSGESLLPIIAGESDGAERVVVSQFENDAILAAISDDWKLIYYTVDNLYELFHLPTDPDEQENRIPWANPREDPVAAAAYSDLAGALTAWIEIHQVKVRPPANGR
jgi:arylsulfatase A-like enzyme